MNDFEILSTVELMRRLKSKTYNQFHLHHTFKPNLGDFDGKNHMALQQSMFRYHTQQRGWEDIGQHVTLMPDGLWVTGRSFDKDPASIKGWNKGAFAIEMLGNFDLGSDRLMGGQKESLLMFLRYVVKQYSQEHVVFHREGPDVRKSCPGTGIERNQLMKEVMHMDKAFKDVPASLWSAAYINAAKDLKIIEGDADGNFNPKAPLSREEAAVMAVRTYEIITGRTVIK